MRQHLEHLAAALAALGFAVFISYFNTGAHAVTFRKLPTPTPTTPIAIPDTAYTPTLIPDLVTPSATREPAPAVPIPKAKPKPKIVPQKPMPASAPSVTFTKETATSTVSISDSSTLLSRLSGSVVNILCISHKPPLRGTSGTGVIIDSRGMILTVAHVAQTMLLEETLGSKVVSCTIRTGSPATTAYHAKLVYISSEWLHANSTTLITTQPTGTGENDFALLAITSSATSATLPTSFPAVQLSTKIPDIDSAVGIGSYGAQYLTSTEVRYRLLPTLVMGVIHDVFTFTSYTPDVLSVLGGKAAQEGSSGGAIVNEQAKLVGIITTSEISGDESTRKLRAITTGHMIRSYEQATAKDFFSNYANKSLEASVSEYADTVQTLGTYLAGAIGLSAN